MTILRAVAGLTATISSGRSAAIDGVRIASLLAVSAALVLTPVHAASSPPPLMIAFGDSITWGANASDNTTTTYQSILPLSDHLPGPGDNTYPGDLGRALQRTVYDYGYPGQTTQTDLPRLQNVLSQVQPKTILLMEGTNDIIGGRAVSDALSGLQTEVNTIIAAKVTVVLLTTTPTCYPADNQYYSRNNLIEQYDAGVRQIATSSYVRLVDIDQAWQQSGKCADLTVRRDGSNDYIHPNDAGNTLIAQTVAAVINLFLGIDRSSGIPGSVSTITASNVEPREVVTATWDCPTDTCAGGLMIGTGTADASGNVTIPLTIPADAAPGTRHVIGVLAQGTGAFGTLTFSLPQVSASINPAQGNAGSKATVSGTNYGTGEVVTAYFDCTAAPCTGKTAIGTVNAASDGKLLLPVTIPASATSATTYTIGVVGGSSRGFKTVSYGVSDGPTTARVAQLSLHSIESATIMRWKLVNRGGVLGFNVYCGRTRLNAGVIPTHQPSTYRFRSSIRAAILGTLEVLLRNGTRVRISFPATK